MIRGFQKNFYLNKGFYDVIINSSFAKLTGKNEFELIYNIDAKEKLYFDNLNLILPIDYDQENFSRINKLFEKLKGEPYSLNSVNDIIEEIEIIVLNEQFESSKASVNEKIVADKINLDFTLEETDRYVVERINIFGNNVTQESVIRNNLSIDEGDIFNELLTKKSENNIKALNLFKKVETKVVEGSDPSSKVIQIEVEKNQLVKLWQEQVLVLMAVLFFWVKENNYLGRGVAFDANVTLNEDSIKGNLGITNPNFQNSDKSVSFDFQISETDKLKDFGYKTNKNGLEVGTNFEFLRDFRLGLGTSAFIEKIETDSTASARQKKMEGDYFDSFIKLTADYDKRNQKYKASRDLGVFMVPICL